MENATVSPCSASTVPTEDPWDIGPDGFYRRWLAAIEDRAELVEAVNRLTGTTQDKWIPVWKELGEVHEAAGERLEADGDFGRARREFLLAKTYYAIARFPGEITPEKATVSKDCVRAYIRACAHIDPPLEVVQIPHQDVTMTAHLRVPKSDEPVPAVLVMCGSDVFKEDRGWAQEICISHGMAGLVMDAPGTGENPVPWAPESVTAWEAAVDALRARPEIDPNRIGAFGISRGGYSVMQLAGTVPDKLQAVVAVAGAPLGYLPEGEEMARHLATLNERAEWYFGAADDGPFRPPMSEEDVRAEFHHWALSEIGVLDRITQPVLMINGDQDYLSPVGHIYSVLEHGPVTGKEARVYAGAGHCAAEHAGEWVPEAFAWLARKLSVTTTTPAAGSLPQH
ncbi:alpha/beta hydrolase [Frankia sp. CNm7]|uniref:Alpha/beta hydrolase n=1 Tax=Frankia nepalensis TaxID=1836974 RepID=A0A937US30_9ACTN|nr:alpha/beta fold hydrolase [Frankia nepalensis]MBL7501996.1 alpha/beta hydrolase [Frankia nepalensis]MBL7510626.1 alpha/beta hydrolase [Frankia nepalensis]MBL7517366.1 alpha/beta hydrolase [Frankia nepalensis]MBL7633449.1 alpha/beta hydrolase [Frankia nepalensis]